MRFKEYIIIFFLVIISGLLLFSDRRPGGYWSLHAFITAIVAGFVTLGVTILGIDRFSKSRDKKRWEFVAHVAYRGLARESRDISTTFASYYCNLDHQFEAAYKSVNFRTDRLTPLGEIRSFPAGREKIAAYVDPLLPEIPEYYDARLPRERIYFLLHDMDWVELVMKGVAELVNRNRSTVAQWATLLMNSDESREQLNYFSKLNDGLFRLTENLGRYRVDQNSDHLGDIWKLFQLNDIRARQLTNQLWHLSGEDSYKFVTNEHHKKLSMKKVLSNQSEEMLLGCFLDANFPS